MFGNMKYPTLWKIAAFIVSQACFTPALAAPVKGSSGKGYTVKSGDTFAKIARTHRVSLPELLRANRVSNPDHIRLGQRIVVPGAAAKSMPAVKSPGKAPALKASVAKTTAGRERKQDSLGSGNTGSSQGRQQSTTVNITPPPAAGTYVVQSGDTLSRIQRRTGTPVASLLKLNKLTESSVIRPGQTLRINGSARVVARNQPPVPPAPANRSRPEQASPVQDTAPVITAPNAPRIYDPAAAPAPVVPAAPSPSATAPHTVESGETFSSIGRLYGLSQSKLIAANPKVNPAKLRLGQTLLIPGQPVRPGAQPVVVRADGRILAQRPDPLSTGVPASIPAERTRTGYLVEEGETLTQIAQRFHTSERELRQLNRLGESDSIYAGRYILVPFIRQAPAAGNTYARRDA
jgi:LysM repeat protein